MQYVKFSTIEDAQEYLPKLQAHYDATVNQDRTKSRVIACIFPTWDKMVALPVDAENERMRTKIIPWPVTSKEIVDNVDPPIVEEPKSWPQ